MSGLSLRVRLTLWYFIPLTGIALILAIAVSVFLWQDSVQIVDGAMQDVAQGWETWVKTQVVPMMDNVPRLGGEPGNPLELSECLAINPPLHLRNLTGRNDIQLNKLRGRAVMLTDNCQDSGYPPLSDTARSRAAAGYETYETTQGRYLTRVFTKPVFLLGRRRSVILMSMSLEQVDVMWRRFLVVLTTVVLTGLLLAAGGFWLLTRRALAQLEHITETAQRINSAEHLTEHLEERGAGDELDRLVRVLNDMFQRLEFSVDQMRRFHVDASHQLKTPIAVQQALLGMALQKLRTPAQYQDFIKRALEQSKRTDETMEGLLLLARADNGVLMPDTLEDRDVDQLLKDVYKGAQHRAESRSISVDLQPLEACIIACHPGLLKDALFNLVDNAVKYTPTGGCIKLSVKRHNGSVCILVSDTGIGVSEAEKESIFTPFYRANSARDHDAKGTGLGLSLACAIIKAHGGTLHLSDNPCGKGSTFTVCLPRRPDHSPAAS